MVKREKNVTKIRKYYKKEKKTIQKKHLKKRKKEKHLKKRKIE